MGNDLLGPPVSNLAFKSQAEQELLDEEQREINYRLNYSDIDASHVLLRKDAVWLGAFLIVCQGLDGFLTSVGIDRFGISVEGNPFLRALMFEFGHVPVLALLKTAAVALVVVMIILASRMHWIRHAMVGVAGVYLFAAIVPWTYILYLQP
jgi:hypothetical protein